ncbi:MULTISPECIES: FAD-dependent monooxygenase [Streptomyces]|uniref:FAD-dependent monooxygenase n=1 Tax=Streptomyces TaxID=1883 RepID=UPI00163C7459|nr:MULTISPECIES: FAD-dependent monooxygenase [Streptomyces]MBC2877566.1 FAD-dependent monooxygenase [Streptomyces sp. TYQ1024]UBI36196.1 FAD-dependent monooxygenase [Streptomyces mobaraensis]UKW28789.1 FAD-dependent monooxygenase [Streptomyces sp. TYQ1024]
MRIAVIGGGPGGLYFSVLARRLGAAREITVYERNPPEETFGFGVVLSDRALRGIERAEPAVAEEMWPALVRWDDIAVHHRGTTRTAGGNGFAAIGRATLLAALRRRCARLGIPVRHGSEITDVDALAAGHDLVVAADGAHSAVRERYADTFRPAVRTGACHYIWLGTDLKLDSFAFHILDTPGGAVQLHAYPNSRNAGTVIVELSERAWHAAGFAGVAPARCTPGESDGRSIGLIAELCADFLGGHKLFGNNSRWLRFPTVRCATWRHRNVVLLGDAAHTAHFSVGSGTQLAMDDAAALAGSLAGQRGTAAALAAYEAERRPEAHAVQRAALASQEWFENIDRYTHQEPTQFAVNLLTRSRRVSHAGLRRRDPAFTARAERWFADAAGHGASPSGTGMGAGVGTCMGAGTNGDPVAPPMLQPFTLGRLTLPNRLVVSADEPLPARAGVPGDLHLVHLGGAALAGAGLVLTGPVAVSAEGTAAHGGAGLHTGEQAAGWRRVADFVHAHSPAKIGLRLGFYGPAVPAASGLRRAFAAAARRATAFDLLELDCAHDTVLSPPTDGNDRPPGGSLRHPLEVFDAIRAEWPADRPLGLCLAPPRCSPDGRGADVLTEIANEFAAHGATAVHVRAATRDGRDVYADRIRNQLDGKGELAVIAAGSISASDVNTIVLAGRADLCVVDRPTVGSPWLAPRGTPERSTSDQCS